MQQPVGRVLAISALIGVVLGASIFWGQSIHRSNSSDLEWRHYGKDLHNTRFLNSDQINSSNISKLRPAWVFHTGVLDPNASLEVSPIVAGGHMFITTGHDDVFALDAVTGEQKWAYHPLKEMPPLSQIAICCGRANRGVAFGRGRVFVGRLDDVLVALDAKSGKVLWKVTVVDFHKHFSITMAPQFVEGLVIVGVSGGEFKVRGQVVAYAAETGNEVWRCFTTVPGSTWEGDSWKTGGATVWQTPAVDRELGLLYLATGNAAPDLNGAHRKGSNLYSSSIVALELHTGAVRWHFQEVHHDLWDYDSAQPPLLFEMARNGEQLPALGHCSKNGNYYILNRATGQPLFAVNEVPVAKMPAWQHPWPTQPVSTVEPLTPLSLQFVPPGLTGAPQYTPPREEEVVIQPGDDGGCEFPPAAYSPRTKFVYYGTRYEPASYHSTPNNTTDLGSTFEEQLPGIQDYGIFGATDTVTGKVMWKIEVEQPAKSGLLVAGDLVFFGEGNGKFHAVDASTGHELWIFNGTSIRHGGGAQAAPIAYVVNGREFVVNAFGGNFADAQSFPPNLVGDAVVAFGLPK